jgi:hypothetical protein
MNIGIGPKAVMISEKIPVRSVRGKSASIISISAYLNFLKVDIIGSNLLNKISNSVSPTIITSLLFARTINKSTRIIIEITVGFLSNRSNKYPINAKQNANQT